MSRRKLSAEKIAHRQDIIRRYREAHNNRPAEAVEMADWAMRNGLWKPSPSICGSNSRKNSRGR